MIEMVKSADKDFITESIIMSYSLNQELANYSPDHILSALWDLRMIL